MAYLHVTIFRSEKKYLRLEWLNHIIETMEIKFIANAFQAYSKTLCVNGAYWALKIKTKIYNNYSDIFVPQRELGCSDTISV